MPHSIPQPVTVPWGSERILISNAELALPAPPTDADRDEVVAAGLANATTALPEEAWRAVARGITAPGAAAAQLRSSPEGPAGFLMEENVEGATLWSLVTRVWTSELLPGIQPRTGMEVMDVPDPHVVGTTARGGPCAVVRYQYKDLEHLRNHVWQTFNSTLAKNDYASSILARKVTRNLIAHAVEFAFEDSAVEPFHALVVRDGITRLASAWKVLAGPDADAAETATLAVEALFGKAGTSPGGIGPLSERLAALRAARRAALADEFAAEAAEPEPGPRAVQIAQTHVVPAQIAVGVEGHRGHLLAPDDCFEDAVRSILASVHVEFKPWDDAAQNVEVITRALKRVIQQGEAPVAKDGLQAIYGLAVGRIEPEDLPREFGDDRIPGTALWRAVHLVHALTRPELHERLKDQAKAIKGGQRMGPKGFAELLGPIVDLPWRSPKRAVSKQARNAWKNGGVLTADVMKEWEPVPTDDFTTLVAPALAGDVDARCTLAVAGGIALIADKQLTRNVGSALMAPKEKGGVPFRADVSQIVEDLSHQGNELGLWTLALAANRFRTDQLPQNAVTIRQFIRKGKEKEEQDAAAGYVHFTVDLARPDKIARDEVGVPVTLSQWDVVRASDEERAERAWRAHLAKSAPAVGGVLPSGDGDAPESATESAPPAPGSPSPQGPDPRPASLRAVEHRRTLRQSLATARDALDQLLELDAGTGSWPPLIEVGELDGLREELLNLQTDVQNLRRVIHGDDDPAEADDVMDDDVKGDGVMDA
ncbi:hypothetical protein [Streptomyces sp. I05A-00742]|uniref:hypothetical protein n=1 Tax=Streptomyces sp. I05A-00742 TaxID=2732853 RepID=UPI001489B524|nr:hypothetical protein [Streptomyces sp. I05A-00742]